MRIERLDEASLPRVARRALDLLALLAVAGMAAWLWPTDRQPVEVDLGEIPWWGSARDLLLEGPDAGEWARNTQLLAQGRLDELDHHRLPSWMVLVALAMGLTGDVVLAGHLVNRLLFLLLGLTAFGLGRLGGGRMVGLLAAALAMGLPHVLSNSQRFGIDMAIAALVPAAMLAALLASRRPTLGLPAGLLAGFVAGLHYTTPPFLLPPLLLLVLVGRGWRGRLVAAGSWLLGAAIAVRLLMVVYPVPSLQVFLNDIANGIAPAPPGAAQQATLRTALEGVREGLPRHMNVAFVQAVQTLRVALLPWGILVALPWAGVLGLGLRPPAVGAGRPLRAFLARTDLGAGLCLLFCLAPLPVLVGVGAPERYGANFLPFAAVLMARGAGSLLHLAEAILRALWVRAPRGPLLVLGLLPFCMAALQAREGLRRVPPPQAVDIGAVLLARALQASFPPGSGVASPMREPLVLAGLEFCPRRVCPTEAREEHYERCLRVLAQECAGEGPIGYVWTNARHFYDPNARRAEMDAWVAQRWPDAEEIRYGEFQARVYRIPRPTVGADEDPLRGLPHPGQAADGSVPPPPAGGR